MNHKHAMFFALFAQGTVAVYLDGRRPGVLLPGTLVTLPIVVLEYGPAQPVPIPDLRIEAAGIRGTLSFGREPFATFVPWDAVWALGGYAAAIEFAGDIPPEVLAARLDPAAAEALAGAGSGRPKFTLVAPEEGGELAVGTETVRAAPALRVVKTEGEAT